MIFQHSSLTYYIPLLKDQSRFYEIRKNEMLSDVGGWEVSECYGRPVFIFLLKKTGFAP